MAIDELTELLRDASVRARRVRATLEQAGQRGKALPRGAVALAELDSAETALRRAIHTFDKQQLEGPLAEVARAADQAEQISEGADDQRRLVRTGILVGAVVLALLGGLLTLRAMWLKRRRRP